MYKIALEIVILSKISTLEKDSTKYYSQNNKNSVLDSLLQISKLQKEIQLISTLLIKK